MIWWKIKLWDSFVSHAVSGIIKYQYFNRTWINKLYILFFRYYKKASLYYINKDTLVLDRSVLCMYLQNKEDHKILTIQDRICSLQGNLLIHSWKCVFWSVNVFILHSFSGLNYSGKKICWGKQIYLQQ